MPMEAVVPDRFNSMLLILLSQQCAYRAAVISFGDAELNRLHPEHRILLDAGNSSESLIQKLVFVYTFVKKSLSILEGLIVIHATLRFTLMHMTTKWAAIIEYPCSIGWPIQVACHLWIPYIPHGHVNPVYSAWLFTCTILTRNWVICRMH